MHWSRDVKGKRQGRTHWHFTDFARYRLLDADLKAAVRSKKQAFCLAATDPIDLTAPGAEYRPWNTDLNSACGNFGALAVREALPAGSGDTSSNPAPVRHSGSTICPTAGTSSR